MTSALQRQMAYDRLLERLYLVDQRWIVKGATALLARDIGVRATIDVDLYRTTALDTAEADLREAAGRDIGDWFRFEIGPRHSRSAPGIRSETEGAASGCPSRRSSGRARGRPSTSTSSAPNCP